MKANEHSDEHGGTGSDGTTSRRTFMRAAGAGALAAGVGVGSLSGTATAQADGSFVQTDGTDFTIDGQSIHFNGSNNFWLMDTYYGTPSLHDTAFSLYDRMGLNFVRTWGFRDGTSEFGEMLQTGPGEYNEAGFERFDSLVAKAGEYGIKLVLPLVNNWEQYGGKGQYVDWVDGASSPDEFYTNEECKQLYKDYVEKVLTRENTITGVEYRNDPAIAIWELGNEPRAGTLSNATEQLGSWMEEMSAHIKSIDDNHLVSTGSEGFYTDGEHGDSYPWRANEGDDFVSHHQIETIDCCSYHMYPIAWSLGAENGSDWIAQHHQDAQEVIGKPAYAGEFGLSTKKVSTSERNGHYQDWYDTLDEQDAAGSLIWQVVDGSRENPPRLEGEPTHGVYEDDTETLSIIQNYGASARAKSDVVLEPNAPHAPTGVALTGRTDTSLDIVWNATVGWGAGADGYRVLLNGDEETTLGAEETTTTLSGLEPGTYYEVAVEAVDVNGETATSNTVSLATLPSETSTVEDPCEDTSNLASGSDTGTLTVDTSNEEYFLRPDGSTDGARLNRASTDDAAMVWSVDGQLLDAAVEFHLNTGNGGSLEFYESTDGGSTWQQVEFVASEYNGPGTGGWANRLHSRTGFSEGADRLKVVITGGDAAWSAQVGHVKLTVGGSTGGTPEPDDLPNVGDNENAPQDPDGDGLYEDVNGNGDGDLADAVDLFQHRESDAVQNNVDAYDFSGNGGMDMADVVDLFQENTS